MVSNHVIRKRKNLVKAIAKKVLGKTIPCAFVGKVIAVIVWDITMDEDKFMVPDKITLCCRRDIGGYPARDLQLESEYPNHFIVKGKDFDKLSNKIWNIGCPRLMDIKNI